MQLRNRLAAAAAIFVAVIALGASANAQPYGGPGGGPGGPAGFAPPGPPRPGYGPPIMNAPAWRTVEYSPGQVWDGIWTFDRNHRAVSAQWVNRATGQRIYVPRMFVRFDGGGQVTIIRPGSGDYIGTLTPDGRSIRGRFSWSPGHFTARM